MAKKIIQGNVIDGIFTDNEGGQERVQGNHSIVSKKQGRPKARDITNQTELIKRGFYITPELDEKLSIAAIKKKMDKSEAVRHILKIYFENHTE